MEHASAFGWTVSQGTDDYKLEIAVSCSFPSDRTDDFDIETMQFSCGVSLHLLPRYGFVLTHLFWGGQAVAIDPGPPSAALIGRARWLKEPGIFADPANDNGSVRYLAEYGVVGKRSIHGGD